MIMCQLLQGTVPTVAEGRSVNNVTNKLHKLIAKQDNVRTNRTNTELSDGITFSKAYLAPTLRGHGHVTSSISLRDQSIPRTPFAIGCSLTPRLYILTFSRYSTPKSRAHTHTERHTHTHQHTPTAQVILYSVPSSHAMYCIGQTKIQTIIYREMFQ